MRNIFVAVMVLSGFISSAKETEKTEATLQQVDLRLCGRVQSRCLLISAENAQASQFQNTMHLEHPKVKGLGFESKQISSAIVDLTNGTILLRERQKNIYVGEWTINLDTLKISFYSVPK